MSSRRSTPESAPIGHATAFDSDLGEFASTCFRMGSKLRCLRSTPTELQSMSENDFECFASTGVNTPPMAKMTDMTGRAENPAARPGPHAGLT